MIGLLDTHSFMWLDSNSAQLCVAAKAFISGPRNQTVVSVVSIWEIVIKHQNGKLPLHQPLEQIITDQVANGIRMIPVELEHVMSVRGLPMAHRDPFDRYLVATAIHEGAVLLSADVLFDQYPVTRVWQAEGRPRGSAMTSRPRLTLRQFVAAVGFAMAVTCVLAPICYAPHNRAPNPQAIASGIPIFLASLCVRVVAPGEIKTWIVRMWYYLAVGSSTRSPACCSQVGSCGGTPGLPGFWIGTRPSG